MNSQNLKSLNIGLAGANPYTSNLGVTALAWSALYILEEIARTKNLQFTYFVLQSNGPATDVFQMKDFSIKTRKISWDFNGRLKSLVKLVFIHPDRIVGLIKLDVVFDLGLGDSFSDIYGMGRFREVNGTRSILQFLNKKLVLLPQTYGPFKSKEAIHSATKTIRKSTMVFTRDGQSHEYVKTLLPDLQMIESIDVAFFLPFVKRPQISDKVTKVGINVSALLWNGGYTKNNQFNLKTDYQRLMEDILSYFVNVPLTEVYLIAHVLPDDHDSIENDYRICTDLHAKYPNSIVAPHFKDPVKAKSFISGMNFFTGARMHACIAAFSTGVPVFPLAYSRKFNGLFGETLKYPFFGDLLTNTKDELLGKIKSAFENREELKNKIMESEDLTSRYKTALVESLSTVFD